MGVIDNNSRELKAPLVLLAGIKISTFIVRLVQSLPSS